MKREESIERIEGVYLLHETKKAWLLAFDMDLVDDDKWWIPISQIKDTDIEEVGQKGYVDIPEWLAEEKGLF